MIMANGMFFQGGDGMMAETTVLRRKEIEQLNEGLIKCFLKKMNYKNVLCVDIERFVTEFLGLDVIYETFAEDDPDRVGFFSDGVRQLMVIRDGIRQGITFPKNTVVIEKGLTLPQQKAELRFSLAHEGSHMINEKHFPIRVQAAFHSTFDSSISYTEEMLGELLNINERYTDWGAESLLMPEFLLKKAFKKYNDGKMIIRYGDKVISKEDRITMRKIADAMGVSYENLYNRLLTLRWFQYRPLEEYIEECYLSGDEEVPFQ